MPLHVTLLDRSLKREGGFLMKRIVALILVYILMLLSLSNAFAITSTLSPSGHGGTAQSGSYTKSSVGNPSVTINSLYYLEDGLYMYFRVRYSNGTAATPHYNFSGTGSRNVYYLNSTIYNDVGSSFFIRVQTQSSQVATLSTSISWIP